jgi:hypothetical protein
MTISDKFQEFLKFLPNQREVGLAMAQDEQESVLFQEILLKNNFKQLKTIFENSDIKSDQYLVVDNENFFKEIYDFACQYPLTIISIYNKDKAENTVIKPDYNHTILFIITKDILNKFNQAGFDLLGKVGLTYQS